MSDNSRPNAAADRAEPESFRARGVSTSFTVKDIHKSVAWYQQAIGFTVDERHERDGTLRAVSLKAGDIRILIGQDDGAKGWDRVKGEGFSVQFRTVQDIDALANRVKSYGSQLESEPADMPWGARFFRVRDPDGFLLVFASETDE